MYRLDLGYSTLYCPQVPDGGPQCPHSGLSRILVQHHVARVTAHCP
eukprot:CAMPEP_0202894796 /NCGR_PEP_ID=MMETSP1392-20130828/4116_1 /ASSEMBLY_ACC=CAM_ASM_000868 /TAXON_ID=225041 /ORGANISM="Chlamydomonas chlamydogama, Strain SAG 11-48b" /LENGTH=45 /DNA_ID= /DNA_START= /DNA_END= /DNA_ORIENTATION=